MVPYVSPSRYMEIVIAYILVVSSMETMVSLEVLCTFGCQKLKRIRGIGFRGRGYQ